MVVVEVLPLGELVEAEDGTGEPGTAAVDCSLVNQALPSPQPVIMMR
jgi:hypothetical protein